MDDIQVVPSPILRKIASPVKTINDSTKNLIFHMMTIMKEHDAIGLAAPQIGINKNILVWNWEGESSYLINPFLTRETWELSVANEGCLSLPGLSVPVERPTKVYITGLNLASKYSEYSYHGFLGRIIQHEYDHLRGILMIDRCEEKYVPKDLLEFRQEI